MSARNDFNDKTTAAILVEAIDSGKRLKEIVRLLDSGADPKQPDKAGRTPMDAAMGQRLYDVADALIAAGAAPPEIRCPVNGPITWEGIMSDDQWKTKRETSLTYYIKNAHGFDQLYSYLANGADVNLPNKEGITPLAAAVYERPWCYVAVQLIKRGAWLNPEKPDPNEIVDETTGATRLLAVIMEGKDGNAVQKILKEGADPNLADRYGLTPVALARALNWPYVEQLLLDAGADPAVTFPDPNQLIGKNNDKPMLWYTVNGQYCHSNYRNALMNAGAGLDALGPDGRGAIHWATINGHTGLFEEMQARGADILSADDVQKLTPLQYACMNNRLEIAARILDVHPEAVAQKTNQSGDTVLHQAAGRMGSSALVQLLVDTGADVNARNGIGNTPLHSAVDRRDADAVRVLLNSGADLDKANEGKRYNPPLFSLVSAEKDEVCAPIAKMLLDAGASPHIRASEAINGPQKGDSILYYAITYQSLRVARELLEAGADPHDTSYIGASAMHHCLHLRHIEGVKLLLEFGFDPLKQFDFTEKWSGGGGGSLKRYAGSAYDDAKALVAKFGHDREYGTMLDLIEDHLMSTAPASAPKCAPKAQPAP